MNAGWWIVAVGIFIIVLIVVLIVGFMLRKNTVAVIPSQSPPDLSHWNKPIPTNDPNKNVCQVYTFQSQLMDDGRYLPANPDYTSLFNITGTTPLPSCIDSDQIVAQQLIRECVSTNGSPTDYTRCITNNGSIVNQGYKEIYFGGCANFNIGKCPGQMSTIALNYSLQSSRVNPTCMSINGTNIIPEPCNITDSKQLFRITRTDPGIDPKTLTSQDGKNGLITQILHRESGLCLSANTDPVNEIFIGTGTSDSCLPSVIPTVVAGKSLTLSPCTSALFSRGYNWLFMPSLLYCDTPSCVNEIPKVINPAMVYIGDLPYNEIPFTTEYQGLTGNNAIFKWLINNNASAVYYSVYSNKPFLAPLSQTVFPNPEDPLNFPNNYAACAYRPFINQYLNVTSYTTTKDYEVCIANGGNATTCIPL